MARYLWTRSHLPDEPSISGARPLTSDPLEKLVVPLGQISHVDPNCAAVRRTFPFGLQFQMDCVGCVTVLS
jgi:hypothetical protein